MLARVSKLLAFVVLGSTAAAWTQSRPASTLEEAVAAPPGTINTIAGSGYPGVYGIPGAAKAADLLVPGAPAVDGSGNLYIPDNSGQRILLVNPHTGQISVFAGTGQGGYSGNGGPALDARLNRPQQLAFGPNGNLYIAESRNNVIRMIDMTTRNISAVVGNGFGAGPTDGDACSPVVAGGKALSTRICNVLGIAFDHAGNLYFANATYQILKVDKTTRIVSLVAGTGSYGYSGDGNKATLANLSWIFAIAIDSNDNLYIADSGNCAVRKVVLSTGIISSIVGKPTSPYSGQCGFSGNKGPASAALMGTPYGLVADADGNVYVADSSNNEIRAIDASNGNIYAVAGIGTAGWTGDGGPATKARLSDPGGLGIDSSGNLYITDQDNFVVRMVTKPATAFLP